MPNLVIANGTAPIITNNINNITLLLADGMGGTRTVHIPNASDTALEVLGSCRPNIPICTSGTTGTTLITYSNITAGTRSTIHGNLIWSDPTYTNITDVTNTWIDGSIIGIYSTSDLSKIRKLTRPNHRPVRTAIKKAIKLITGLGFDDELKVFLGGNEIEISHPDSNFKFVITKYNNDLISRTKYPGHSAPFKLELYTKSNVFVSKLCVYLENTPILDQLLGVIMFIKTGAEDMILEQSNFYGLTDNIEIRDILSQQYPQLSGKLKPSSLLLH